MNEQLNEALTKLIEKALSGIDAAGDFMAGEVPEVINQLLVWHAVESFIHMIFGLILIFAPIIFSVKYWKKIEDACAEPFLTLIIFPAIIGSVVFDMDWLKILIAPKIYLLEYAAKIVS